MRQLILVTVLLGFLVSAAAIFLGDAFFVAKPAGEIASAPPNDSSANATLTLRLMRWLAEGAARVNFGKDHPAEPGFRIPSRAAVQSPASDTPAQAALPIARGHSGSPNHDEGILAGLP